MTTNFPTAPPRPFPRSRPITRLGVAWVLVALTLLTVALIGAALLSVGVGPSPRAVVHDGLIAYDSNGDIWVADADGSHPRPLIQGAADQVSPSWSPDGTRIAYFELLSGLTDTQGASALVHVANADGTGDIDLTDGTPLRVLEADIRGPVWSPDSSTVAVPYYAPPKPGNGIQTFGVDGSTSFSIDWADVPATEPAWSTTGQIAFAEVSPSNVPMGLWVVAPDGSGRRPLVTGSDNGGVEPDWSPTGTQLVYGCPGGTYLDVCVIGADGSEPLRVSDDPAQEYLPVWSPTGEWIAFHRMLPGGNDADIYLVRPDGSELHRIDVPPTSGPIVWSPTGGRLLTWNRGFSELRIVDVEGTSEPVSIPDPAEVGGASWQRLASD